MDWSRRQLFCVGSASVQGGVDGYGILISDICLGYRA
jgi:hypothetical protein